MQVRVEEHASREFTLAPDGELDMATEPLLTDAAEALLAGGGVGTLVVDLVDLRFLDSSGMRALLRVHRLAERQGAKFMVIRPRPQVAEVLRIAALDHIIGIDGPRGRSAGDASHSGSGPE